MPDIVIPEDTNLPLKKNRTLTEELQQEVTDYKDLQNEDILQTVKSETNKLDSEVNGNVNLASANPDQLTAQGIDSLGAAINQPRYVDPNAQSVSELNRTWAEEFEKGFMRGVGQTISSTGDLINFIGSALPGVSMFEGNILGNNLVNAGNELESQWQSAIPEELKNENLTWGSLMNPDFWSKRGSEMLPLALEFLFISHGAGAAARGGAKRLASRVGAEGLQSATQTTSTVNRLSGLTKIDDVVGTGRGLMGKLVRNVNGQGELTQLGMNASSFLGAGITSNLTAGAMNAMELHRQMKAEVNSDGSPKYTEEELSQAAAGSFATNMLYLPIDVLSWGVTYGGGLKNLRGMLPKNGLLNNSGAILKDASTKFTGAVMPFMGPGMRVASKLAPALQKAAFEGLEETFQETFEEWAKLKGRAKVTGEDVPTYWDFYNSDENRATKVLSAAAGGLMGGGANISEMFNTTADNMAKYYDRVENLRTSIDAEDKLGQEAREYHIQNQMFDLINEGKEEFFGDFISSLTETGQISEEQANNYEQLFNDIKVNFDAANNLNVSGKEALMRATVESNFLEGSIQRDIAAKAEAIKTIQDMYDEGPEQQAAIEKETKVFDESINSKLIMLSKSRANKLNLISGKKADPTNIKFVVSKTGKEHFLVEEKIIEPNTEDFNNMQQQSPNEFSWTMGNSQQDMNTALDQGGIVAGLSDQQYKNYVEMTDDQIYEQSAKRNKKAIKGLKGKAQEIYQGLKDKFLNPENTDANNGQDDTIVDESILSTPAADAATGAKPDSAGADNTAEATEKDSTKENASSEESQTTPETTEDSEEVPERAENENEFEREAIDNPEFIDKKKKTLREKQSEEDAAAEQAFLSGDNTDIPSVADNAAEGQNTAQESEETINAQRQEELSAENITPEQTEAINKKYDNRINKLPGKNGKASIIGKIGKRLGITQAVENMAQENSRQVLEQRISQVNTSNASTRRQIALKALANNPTIPVSKNQLDNYLNSAFAKFQYGPNQMHKMIALNQRFKGLGIDIDVISASNLFETVGIDATGYAIANTVFIDEKAWEQTDIFMHEMSHIYYRSMKDNPVVQKLIGKAQGNTEMVERLKRLYFDDVKYMVEIDADTVEPMSMRDLGGEGTSAQDVADFMKEQGFAEAPLAEQDIINEELFVNYLQGPLSKQFDSFFKPTQEFGRRQETRSFWSWLKGESVKYVADNRDLVQALNDGEAVSQNDMKQFIMQGFTDAIANKKSTLSASGAASRIARNTAAAEKKLREISQDKVKQQIAFDKRELLDRFNRSLRDKEIARINRTIDSDENLNDKQKEIAREQAMEELENSYEDTTLFDDFEQVKPLQLKGATRILNSFVKSLNYVKRQTRLRNSNKLAADYDDTLLEDRDALISEIYNLAYETKGNTSEFINQIENSDIQEIDAFNKYLDKVYPAQKLAILSSMGWVMSNSRTISGVKSYVDARGNHMIENALSEREKNAVNSHMKRIERLASSYYKAKKDNVSEDIDNPFAAFETAYRNIQQNKGTNEDYLAVVKFLSPYNVRFSNIIKSNNINFKGSPYTVKNLIGNFVKQNVLAQPGGNLYIGKARSIVEAIADTNRKYTSYSSIQNAEGNFEPSKITNNHLLSEIDRMNAFLSTKVNGRVPTFKKFKEMFGHIGDASKRKMENPVLKSIYDNFVNGKSLPSVTQYFGLKNDQAKINNLYKNSTDFTQSIEDFMMFNASTTGYLQNMGAFADSPRKFYMQVNKMKYEDMFSPEGKLTSAGTNQLRNAFNIYQSLNQNLSEAEQANTFKTYEDFVSGFNQSVRNERKLWETFGQDLRQLPQLAKFFTGNGKLNTDGNKKITEYVFNNSVNGLSLSEIFNPGVPVKDIVKRNKGNSSPVNSIGNPNLKIEPIIIADANDKSITDSAMYMLRSDAEKIVRAGLGVFDMNNGLKLLNYSVDRDNENFAGRAAYFKGYTTIIDESTLISEPGLRGIHELLLNRKEQYETAHERKHGEYPSEDLLNGLPNYLNVAIPMSAIKSDFLNANQKAQLGQVTFDRLNQALDDNSGSYAGSDWEALNKIYDDLFYKHNEFVGISGYNFGPQQVMDKITTESTTPVQFISALIVNGATQGTLAKAEEIQRLIRRDMTAEIDAIIEQLNNMNPKDYKKFILENIDLENMDQAQRLIMQQDINNLNHTAIEDFVLNTLANRLKTAGNKLKTAGTIAQQKSNIGYQLPKGYYVNGSNGLQGYTQRDNGGQNPLEIVLPKHMQGTVRSRMYLTLNEEQNILKYLKPQQAQQYLKSTPADKLKVIQNIAQSLALNSYPRVTDNNSYGAKNADLIGTVEDKNGNAIGYFVKGEVVLATRVPSHGPASTGVFEVVDFLSGEGNQTVVSNEFSKVIGSDYDGDALFIQRKSKATPNFNKALDMTVELWTSPEMAEQIQTSIDFEKEVSAIVRKNKATEAKMFPMSPEYNRDAYNNTMVSKRSIGVIFNMHRLANYLAAYDVKVAAPITIDGSQYSGFADNEVGQNSRNNNSAKLANIILDNSKYHFADKLGLNDQTINQFALLTNMGVSLSDLNKIMNSDAVAVWTKYKKNNQSPYLKNKSARELRELIKNELGIGNITKTTYNINTAALSTPQQKANIIATMEYLEDMNSDVLKLSKIMAGHKGINNNPFILEKQLADFNAVVDNQEKNLVFNTDFKNNPDIKAYQENAEKILDILKKANKIFRPSTEKMLAQLDTELALDGLNERQLQRASDMIKKFINSRVLGLNNIAEEDKIKTRQEIFDKVYSYMESLAQVELPGGRNGLEKSILFQKALNIYFHILPNNENGPGGIDAARSYISANPAFFNESLSAEEKQAVQKEFNELNQDIKDDLIVYDLMKNGLTGNLSLVNVFDDSINWNISNLGAYDQINKNKAINGEVMQELKDLIIANEIASGDTGIPIVNYKGKIAEGKIAAAVRSQQGNGLVYNKMRTGDAFYFVINDNGIMKPYYFSGLDKSVLRAFESSGGNRDGKEALIMSRIENAITPYQAIRGDLNLKAISIADAENTFRPYTTSSSYNIENDVDHMVEANIIQEEKKKNNEGRASKIDYHNYNDYRPLTRVEYDRVMEYNPAASEAQKQTAYDLYLAEKEKANALANDINQAAVVSKTDAELKKLYSKYADKDVYAYSIVTTPIIMEFANRAALEQSQITGRYEDGNDMSLISSWMNNNNIPSNHPATQALIRQLTSSYKTFVKERGKYIKEINKATEALYKEKFKLSNYRIVAIGQRLFNSIFRNRQDLYNDLYGNLVETIRIKLPNGQERTEFKFRDKQEIDAARKEGFISDAEYDFYTTFRGITSQLQKFGSPDDKVRRDYIPHTAMGNFELFSSRGVLGLMVNSRPENDAIGDVKMYFTRDDGKKELLYFNDIRNNFNAIALDKGNKLDSIREYKQYLSKAKKLLKEGKNEDGTRLEYSHMEIATAMGMGPMSRFASSRSISAEQMPSMDLNKALVDYVHSTLFAYGNENFEGFQELMPLIDGVMAYNEKNGYKNSYNYVKEVVKEKFINKRDQNLLGPKADKVVNGLVKGNLLYALGYKGFIVGKGLYAIGNVAIGKYMNIKREGGKAWLNGELRYWGTDKGFNIDALQRRRRAKKILSNLGYMEIDLYDDVAVESKSGLDGIFTSLALLPMSASENWIQKAQFLGMLTEEEFDMFDDNGEYKFDEFGNQMYIPQERLIQLEERVKSSHGKGYLPTDQSRIQTYSLGRMFLQFSRHLPTQIRERFAKEDVDMNGQKYIGSLRQMYVTASDIVNNKMTPEAFKKYYATLAPHEKEALQAGMRGMAMIGLAGFINANLQDSSNPASADNISRGVISDANTHFDADKLSYKMVPPSVHTITALMYKGNSNAPE